MTRRPTLSLLRTALWPAVALFVIAYFAFAAVVGPNGLLSLAGYKDQKARQQVVLQTMEARRAQLHHRAQLLDPAHVDPDLADEIVRQQTGQVRPDEVILPTN